MMKLVEIFLPCQRPSGLKVDTEEFDEVQRILTSKFGGSTAYQRAAVGRWKRSEQTVEVDDITVIEVVIDELDRNWWSDYKNKLANQFDQDEILIRVTEVTLL